MRSTDTLRLTPLGGLGEIGLNMMVLEHDGALLLIDCGLMFPESYMPGIDLVLPDVSALDERIGDIRALLLTHGHEDHIGAVPFLLQRLGNPPVYGTALTLGLLKNKLKEHGLERSAKLNVVELRQSIDLEPFGVEFFRAAHSIVDGAGLAIRTAAGLVVHTGDFKLDQTPVDGERTDLARLAALGEEGVLLLLSDSTNVEHEGITPSERCVGEILEEIIPRCPGRVILSTFSSNIHRIQQAVDAAVMAGRKISLEGRSLVGNVTIARQLGCLQIPDEALIDPKQMQDYPPEKVLLLTTGSQGEPMSALARMAMNDHRQIEIEEGDTVILSSKFIPGNEKAISNLINHLYRRGAEVIYEKTSEIHVSGHASQEELKTVMALTRPHCFVPVHGEFRHLVKHAQLAQQMGIPAERTAVLENGQPLTVSMNGLTFDEPVETGRIFVDGKGVGDVGHMELRDRRHLANHGLVIAVLGVHPGSGEIVYGPELLSRGFIPEEGTGYLDEAIRLLREKLGELSPQTLGDTEELQQEVRRVLRRFFNRTIDRRPLIVPVILEP